MPMQTQFYPPDWRARALAVKEAADWRCVECERICFRPGEKPRSEEGKVLLWRRAAIAAGIDPDEGFVPELEALWEEIDEHPIRFVLTVAHLDHDPANPEARLAALCSVCHLRHDGAHHSRQASATRERRKAGATESLPGME